MRCFNFRAFRPQGYAVDVCCSHLQLQELCRCCQKLPGTSFILDHLGLHDESLEVHGELRIPIGIGSCAPYGKAREPLIAGRLSH